MINDPERLSLLLVTGPMVVVPVAVAVVLALRPVHRTVDPSAGESVADGRDVVVGDRPSIAELRTEAGLRGR